MGHATNEVLTIGRVAASTGLSTKAIRLYETHGLIDPPQRTPASYRTYTTAVVAVLRFIRQAQALGLSLKEIKQIIDLQRRGQQPCELVTGLLDSHLAEIDRRINELATLRRTLHDARNKANEAAARGETAVICHIIETPPLETPD